MPCLSAGAANQRPADLIVGSQVAWVSLLAFAGLVIRLGVHCELRREPCFVWLVMIIS